MYFNYSTFYWSNVKNYSILFDAETLKIPMIKKKLMYGKKKLNVWQTTIFCTKLSIAYFQVHKLHIYTL